MRLFMVKLSRFLTRRRWLVVGAWLAVVAFSLPFAARQTEDLSGGGFDVPGSQSEAVEQAVMENFETGDVGRIMLVLEPQEGATPEQRAAAVERPGGRGGGGLRRGGRRPCRWRCLG